MTFPNLIGLIGVGLTLLAYFLLVLKKVVAHSYSYVLLNLIGSLFIMYSLFFAWNIAAFAMELSWLAVSLYGLYQAWRSPMNTKKQN